jgi:protocatechuate 3,4-dioxygenase beta subunit
MLLPQLLVLKRSSTATPPVSFPLKEKLARSVRPRTFTSYPRLNTIYVDVLGEYVRKNISETQPGITVVVDAQFININTCEPVTDLMWDLWHANSTGVYGGVIGSGNGNEDDLSNLNNTFLRGLQPTDSDGVAQFDSIFPGHYSGRATHMHVVGHLNGTILPNGTYTGGTIAHVGQLFFDQDLITEVNFLSPYIENTIAITENVDDRVVAAEVDNDADPFFNYVLLGDTVADGLFMWITMGVDTTASYSYSAAAELTADGGIELSSSTSTTGSGNGTGNGTAPSGVAGVSGSATGTAVTGDFTGAAYKRSPFRFFG